MAEVRRSPTPGSRPRSSPVESLPRHDCESVTEPDPLRVSRLDCGEAVIPEAPRLAEAFFAIDPSSRGETSYDALSAAAAESNRIRPEDVTALNTSMRARTSPERWQDLFDQDDLPWLRGLDSSWDLVEMADTEWHNAQVGQRIREALDGIVAPYRNISVATKMLHFKRPRLIPVLDSLVLEMLGVRIPADNSRERRLNRASGVIVHLREDGRRQAEVLREVQAYLASGGRAPAGPDPRCPPLGGAPGFTGLPRGRTRPEMASRG